MEDKVSILLVEDEKVTRETLKIILEEEENYRVKVFESGPEAIEAARKGFFNVAILDLRLPGMDGLEVLREIKKILPYICIFIITAYPTIESSIEAMKDGAYDYILKPYDINQIKFIIRRGLEKQKLVLENKKLLENLQIEKEKLGRILQIGKRMSAILKLDDLVNFIIHKVTELVGAEKGSVMLIDEHTGELVIKSAKGLDGSIIEKTRVKLGEMIAGWVAEVGEPLLIEDIETDSRFRRKNRPQYKSKSFLILPLKSKDKAMGVINVSDKISPPANIFTKEDLKILSVIIHQAAIAIENSKLYEKINSLSITDGLTELFNHRYFQEHLSIEIERAKRYSHPLSLIMLDIDLFKQVNDSYGHIVGDFILRQIALIIKEKVRKVDIPCRYGGEEFAIILPEIDGHGAFTVAERMRKAVEDYIFKRDPEEEKIKLTISAGVAEYQRNLNKEELIKIVDGALYQAKETGRNKTIERS